MTNEETETQLTEHNFEYTLQPLDSLLSIRTIVWKFWIRIGLRKFRFECCPVLCTEPDERTQNPHFALKYQRLFQVRNVDFSRGLF